MRKLIPVLSLLAALALCGAAFATTDVDNPERNVINPAYGLWRGLANTATCWLEYPRCIVYDTDRLTPMGIFLAPFTGTFYCGSRIVLSAFDFVLLGCTGPGGYNDGLIREYVFQMPWNAYREQDKLRTAPVEKTELDTDGLPEVNLNNLL